MNNITYDFTSPEYDQDMNPIGLSYNFYNKHLFDEIDVNKKDRHGPLHNPRDNNINYAYKTAPYHSGGIPGTMESVEISDSPIKKEVNIKDMYEHIAKTIKDINSNLASPDMNKIGTSITSDQMFESQGLNSSVTGNSQGFAYGLDIANYSNDLEYNIEKETPLYTSFLKKHFDDMMKRLSEEQSTVVQLRASKQRKFPNQDSSPENISVASQYAYSTNQYGVHGAEGAYPISY